MIKKDEIEYAAKLARIKLLPEEKERLEKDLSNILNYIEKLQKLNTDNIELMSHSTKLKNVMRNDIAEDSLDKKDIIDLFPEKEKRFIKVRPIL